MFPHDHPWLDEEPELMNAEKKEMAEYLDQVIQTSYKDDKGKKKDDTTTPGQNDKKTPGAETPGNGTSKGATELFQSRSLIDKIHAFMFVYDASNKRTF